MERYHTGIGDFKKKERTIMGLYEIMCVKPLKVVKHRGI